jgi:hypothetical protein
LNLIVWYFWMAKSKALLRGKEHTMKVRGVDYVIPICFVATNKYFLSRYLLLLFSPGTPWYDNSSKPKESCYYWWRRRGHTTRGKFYILVRNARWPCKSRIHKHVAIRYLSTTQSRALWCSKLMARK